MLIYANAEQLMEVLLELIQNAIKALHKKGGSIHLQLEEKDNQIALFVKDDGHGISVEIRKELFKKVIKSEKGSGIGLFLCSKIMQELGGALYLEDTSKKGTTFKILMPATDSAEGS